jgi:hypothetical protein
MKLTFKSFIFALLLILVFVSFSQAQTCNDSPVYEIDMIKQNAETMLVYSVTAAVKMETGESLLAFYLEGKLIKLTVDNSENEGYMIAELFFKDGFIRHVAEEYRKDGKFYKDYYYFNNNKLICYENEHSGDYKDSILYSAAEKKWLEKVDKYLLAIQ